MGYSPLGLKGSDMTEQLHFHFHIIGVPKEWEREKEPEKIFEYIIAKTYPNLGKEKIQPSSGSTESSRQNKPKEGHIETQSNQSDKN